jgi:hypothetical protein
VKKKAEVLQVTTGNSSKSLITQMVNPPAIHCVPVMHEM